MTRKQIKKRLSKLIQYKSALPRLIDCSQVYGDNLFKHDDMDRVNRKIAEFEQLLEKGQQ